VFFYVTGSSNERVFQTCHNIVKKLFVVTCNFSPVQRVIDLDMISSVYVLNTTMYQEHLSCLVLL